MIPEPEIVIKPFHPAMQDEVHRLITSGLAERFGFEDAELNPDLADIALSYAVATFLAAISAGRIVGTGALVAEAPEVGRIVRMSVKRSLRRRGIGTLVLAALIAQARRNHCRRLVIETTADWQDALAFYAAHGFRRLHIDAERNEAHMELPL